ncbi:LOW QUALITY PROTEIN: hypothetical protein Cgig2_031125 [Carnegiea gigantea]|uniref:CoA carboxyltransferase N-terminal domain-containing protein n=1 Tax=Carnegiea gigantea TaxID=171969 RepID=A0A9Q1GRI1_9CARY|nr:LOW QUALITY PROTEIN: hypothetical protein Cgig2_031125 [Carnegiea gigantea]
MSSSERIDLPIDPGTWNPMDKDMISTNPIEFDKNPTKKKDPIEFDRNPTKKKDPTEFDRDSTKILIPPKEADYKNEDHFCCCKCKYSPTGIKFYDTQNRIDADCTNPVADINSKSKSDDINSKSESDEGNYKSESDDENSKSESADKGNSKAQEAEAIYKAESDEGLEDYVVGSGSGERDYNHRLHSYQEETGLTEAVQTGTGQLNGIPLAIGVMDFKFIGGSMGSVVGEKITRLIEYATKKFLPVILVCASGGARMQEGSLSLMEMAKISAALHKHQKNQKLFYISILTTPTTGGVTASFCMLGDLIFSEPNADIAFAGKRVIEQTLNLTVPEDLQTAENFLQKGLLDLIIPRNILKNLISELLKLHALNKNQVEHKCQLFV